MTRYTIIEQVNQSEMVGFTLEAKALALIAKYRISMANIVKERAFIELSEKEKQNVRMLSDSIQTFESLIQNYKAQIGIWQQGYYRQANFIHNRLNPMLTIGEKISLTQDFSKSEYNEQFSI